MEIKIDEKAAQKNDLTVEEVLLLLLVRGSTDIKQLLQQLLAKQAVVKTPAGYQITARWNEVCDNILLSSLPNMPKDEELEPLAIAMMKTFPAGKKEGTNYFFKCNKREVILKLKKFTRLYGHYSNEEILNATKHYVESFQGDYTYMRLLKYFILKEERVQTEEGCKVEEVSPLATVLENKGDVITNTYDSGELI